jgi:hypothetical protein
MCSVRTDLLKQENEKIDSMLIYLDFNLLLTNRNLSPITFKLSRWKNIENLTCIFVKNNLEMCHNFRHVFRGTIDFARVTLHIQQ